MKFIRAAEDFMFMNVGDVIEHEPMYKHTTYRVGGPARLYIKVKDVESLKLVIRYCRLHRIPYMVIGKGSNLLFNDKEFMGTIISLENFKEIHYNGCEVKAQAGVSMIALSYDCAKVGLSGFEFMGGIPGTIGGGIYMNAGAYKYDIASVVKDVTVLTDSYDVMTLSKEEMEFSYRHSILHDKPRYVVLEATFVLTPKDSDEIKAVLEKRKLARMTSQPYNKPSAGSVFRNPEEMPAWKCVDECGLRGYEIGGAQVSPKHSNFIINNGYASAKDVYDLIFFVKNTVKEKLGISLHEEVRFVNWE